MKSTHTNFSIDKSAYIKIEHGKISNKYKIKKEIGRGVSGIVYQAEERSNLKNVKAIKAVPLGQKQEGDDPAMNQLQILSQLDHPDIIKLYETYEDEGKIFYVTDYCDGGELFDYLEMKCYLSEEEARYIFMQMLGAIKYCHSLNIAHRDLKPENFLLLKKPGNTIETVNLKLIDFGLAYKWKNDMQEQILALGKKRIVGTAYYISPQIIEGKYDQKCDIWSLGVILYILVTGTPPFDGDTDKEILKNIEKRKISYTTPEMANVSMLLKDLLRKILRPANQRISIDEIYKHPWMTVKLNKAPISIDFKIMASFSKFSKIKAIAATYLASQMTAKETQNMSRLFKALDQNHDGFLTLEELQKYLYVNKSTLPPSTLNQLHNLSTFIESAGVNGKVNYTEFLSSTIPEQVLSSQQNLEKSFKMLDRDGNGFVDRQQLLGILSKHGHVNSEDALSSVNQIFDTTDENKDGKIDFNQFVTAILKI